MIKLRKRNADKLIKQLDSIFDKNILKDTLKKSAELKLEEIQANFKQQGRIYGNWKPLSEATRRDRESKGYNAARPILIRSGSLKDGFNMKIKGSGKKMKAIIDNETDYWQYHQTGTKKMPQRKIAGVNTKVDVAIGKMFVNKLAEHAKKQ